jgi:pimeloyl-ACP methyl ester carboxylesterase
MKKLSHIIFAFIAFFAIACNPFINPGELSEGQEDKQYSWSANTYVLVHGAWHPEESWDLVKQELTSRGHQVITMQLPGLGHDNTLPSEVTFADHVQVVKDAINSATGKVILVGHSYGGFVVSQAAEELSSKIEKVVFLSAFMPVNGESLLDLGPLDTASVAGQNLIIDTQNMTAWVPSEVHVEAFYTSQLNSGTSGEEDGEGTNIIEQEMNKILPLLKPHPLATFATPVQLTSAFGNLPKVYISCRDDQAITVGLQEYMFSRYLSTTHVVKFPGTDHSPFVTNHEKLIKVLDNL